MIRNVLRIHDLQQQHSDQRSMTTSASAATLSDSQTSKKENYELQLKLKATKLLKMTPTNKLFDRKEARKFLEQLVKSSKRPVTLLNFETWFKEADRSKRNLLEIDQMYKLVMCLAKQTETVKEDETDKERIRLQNMIRSAHTTAKVKKTIDAVWKKFDTDGNGVLDMREAKLFIRSVL